MTPIAPTFSPNVFVPFPDPNNPANTVPSPSVPIPLLIAWSGTGGASVNKVRASITKINRICHHAYHTFEQQLDNN